MRFVFAVAVLALGGSCDGTGACEYWGDGSYYCWQGEYQDFCEAFDSPSEQSAFHSRTRCDALGYTHRCTSEEIGADALQQEWTAGEGCDRSVPPEGRTPGAGSGGSGAVLKSCTDAAGVCSELLTGSASAFEAECRGEGSTPSDSPCTTGAYQCLGATGSSNGSSVSINLQWPAGVCDVPPYKDYVYLRGTCDSLGGTYTGDPDACCSGSTAPGPGGTFCL